MKERIKSIYRTSALATKIRYSYVLLVAPLAVFLIFCFYNMWSGNRKHEQMIESAIVASEFSLDFQKDFDYETYLVIVENKTMEEAKLSAMLTDANRIVADLEEITNSQDNIDRLESAKRYLENLQNYTERIKENLLIGNKYEENLEIWENDVQIVTSLLRETIFEYIYYEIDEIQTIHEEYQSFYMKLITFSIVIFVIILVVMIFLSYYIPLSITRPIRHLSQVTDQVARGNLDVRSDVQAGAEVGMLSESLNTMIDKIDDLLDQVKKEQVSLRKAEFQILQSQINPHFLYNTLDAIVWLAESGEQKKVVNMVGSLSDFFRTSLNQGKDIISLKEELQHVRSYLEIQQMRYQDILQYEIDVDEDLNQYLIPKITIQPLVENALYHGIKNRRGLGQIRITAEKEKGFFIIHVEDNGIGMKAERLYEVKDAIKNKKPTQNDVYGLYNVNERIRLNFGERYGISIQSTYLKGSIVNIILPYLEENKQK